MTKTVANIPIQENDAVYYAGQMRLGPFSAGTTEITFNPGDGGPLNTTLISNYNSAFQYVTDTGNFNLHVLPNATTIPDVSNILADGTFYVKNPINNTVGLQAALSANEYVFLQLSNQAIGDNYGSYRYTSLDDVINNFLIMYVGDEKTLTKVKRTDVLFTARRAMQELSYDTLPSAKSIEATVPINLTIPIPKDYVNYVKMSYIDDNGVLHIIYPLNGLSSNPTDLTIDDGDGIPLQSFFGNNLQASQSLTEERWAKANQKNISGSKFDQANIYDHDWWKQAYGQRYGLSPELSQNNGYFSINERLGVISFSSNLSGRLINVDYISDGLSLDLNSLVPKMVEDALYSKIMAMMIMPRRDVDPGTKAFWKRDAYVKTRNAKIRLSNLKLDEIVQVFRGQSKWIKH